ncbi:hypothetical protein PMZ80_003803 [Knufia obscura]|uniref:Protein-serine/threonine kinase n=2 Tax=Knufia TaxID=430999 RepID=A0AAN8IC97_9EURO|nr:hypothetical protein PMZ80_003803 [Knufia obscura]KAK5958280.1 hypothetical protein OHC33_000122 [Knufia fluminis]
MLACLKQDHARVLRLTRQLQTTASRKNLDAIVPKATQQWSHMPSSATISEQEISRLATLPRRPLTLADLVRHGKPPLSDDALLSSANFTLSLLPARLAHRIQRLRNLPFIVVANPHINKIYNNYLHSLSILEPFYQKRISTMEEEEKFTEVMADLVQTHTNTIPTLAQGFLECRKYIDPIQITKFLDQHLRARIGTRLIAEQHLALHMASTPEARQQKPDPYNIGVIDSSIQPARIVRSCEAFVGDICEFKYGVRPKIDINGSVDATFAHVPVHLEYILTELIKNAFRATIESGSESHPIEVTLAAAPDVPMSKLDALKRLAVTDESALDFTKEGLAEYCTSSEGIQGPINSAAPTITIRIRDRGGGIPPDVLPNIWSYSFTTFNADEAGSVNSMNDGLNAITNGGNPSSIAGLGYGLPLGRAYAEYFGGSIAVQSMHGWGTDVYLSLQGIGKVV